MNKTIVILYKQIRIIIFMFFICITSIYYENQIQISLKIILPHN